MKKELNEIKDKLKKIISKDLDIDVKVEDIMSHTKLFEGGLELDSISVVNLIVLIEQEFNIILNVEDISPERFKDIDTLSQCIFLNINKSL